MLDAQDKVVRTVPVVEGKADFYYLNPGKYGARLINDTNGNGVWDTGDYAARRQPEMVYYYPQVLEFKANFDLIQDWNVKEKPLDKQKPDELKKQKGDLTWNQLTEMVHKCIIDVNKLRAVCGVCRWSDICDSYNKNK